MSAPRFRNLAAPLGILLFSAFVGARISRGLNDELGDLARWLGLAILLAGLASAVWLWRGRHG